MGHNQPEETFDLQVKTDLEQLSSVIEWFEKVTRQRLAETLLWQCEVAITEGFTNTVRHAHQNLSPATTINLQIIFFSDYLEMKIWNWGKPFDLEAKLKTLPSDPPDSWEEEQGRGLYYILKLMDEVEYIRVDNNQRNCLIMRKKISNSNFN